jgi:hypothetical protein
MLYPRLPNPDERRVVYFVDVLEGSAGYEYAARMDPASGANTTFHIRGPTFSLDPQSSPPVAVSEKLCWEVLKRCKGQSVSSKWSKGDDSDDPPIENALPLVVLERELVLRHGKHQIDDSLYFLEKRGYLIKHGYSGLTRVAYQLSNAALTVLESGTFSAEEQQAFREFLVDVRQPGLWGMKLNLAEAWRRFTKWRKN